MLLCLAASAAVVPNRYIVVLSTEPVAKHVASDVATRALSRRAALASSSATSHRALIRAEQETARRQIEDQEGGTVLGQVDTLINALFVRMDDARAARLAQVPGVLSVHKVYATELSLDRAAVIHKLPQAWAQVGIANAGLGMKIGIIDTGIDIGHPGFQDPSLPVPAGYPKVSDDSNLPFTNNKVIVARSYPDLLDVTDPDPTARDRQGHGTAVAMCAAGVQTAGPLATISGMAPRAYLGSYKVIGSPGVNDSPGTDATIQAFNDAVNDGMDVVNLSSGTIYPLTLGEDPTVDAVENAVAMGVIVVTSAGNQGSGLNTVGSPANAPNALAVGASQNDRSFLAHAAVDSVGVFIAYPGDKNAPSGQIRAPLGDVAALDGEGRACAALPANSLTGKIALIFRGPCTFEIKLNNVAAAGAVAGLIYSDTRSPVTPALGAATIPAQMISNADGLTIKSALASLSSPNATLDFTLTFATMNSDKIVDFSSRGPNVDLAIKPEIVAVGQDVYTAAQKLDSNGDVYDPSGFILLDGTSFSSPIAAGAAAVVKAYRPGLTVAQYRSLLIDNAAPISGPDGSPAHVQLAGGGLLDVSAALNATATAVPATIGFSAGSGNVSAVRSLTISNIGTTADTFQLSATPRDGGIAPQLSAKSLTLQPGASSTVQLTFAGSLLQAGQYEGSIHIQGSRSSIDTHVPYWYGVVGTPATLVDFPLFDSTRARAGARVTDAYNFRVLDASGIPLQLTANNVQVTVTQGDGAYVSLDRNIGIPGGVGVNVRLGATPGDNIFHIQVGDLGQDFVVTGR